MSLTPMTAPAIVCMPGAIPASARAEHFALAARLFNEIAVSRTALSDGYEVRFPGETLTSVAQFVANERLCCPFMRFDIELHAGISTLVLRMTGPLGTREVLDAELWRGQCDSTGCGCNVA